MSRRVVTALTMLAFVTRSAAAHPVHTTLAVLAPDPAGHAITITIRAFADDFSASVARFAGRNPPSDSSVVADEVTRYVRVRFTVADAEGAMLRLEPCGVRRTNELYWLCFRVALVRGAAGARIRNQMLTELHADQVNIVQLERGTERQSYLFTKGSATSTLPR